MLSSRNIISVVVAGLLLAGCAGDTRFATVQDSSVSDRAVDSLLFEAETREERRDRFVLLTFVGSEKAYVEAVHGDSAIGPASACIRSAKRAMTELLEKEQALLFLESDLFRVSLVCRDYLTSDVRSIVGAILTPGVDTSLIGNVVEQAGAMRSAALDARYINGQYQEGEISRTEMIKALNGRIKKNLGKMEDLL